jgi:hypothetical protein
MLSRRLVNEFLFTFHKKEGGDGGGSGDSGGNGGGGNTGKGSGDGSTQDPPNGDGNGGDDSGGSGSGGDNKGKGKPPEFTPEQQAHIDKLLGTTRTDARRKALDDAKKEQETEDARKKGEFEKLYNDTKTKVDELEPYKARCEEYETRFNSMIDAQTKDWPEELKELDPGKDNAKARLEWFERSRKLAERLKTTVPNPEHGSGSHQQRQGKTTDVVDGFLGKRYKVAADR